MRYLIAGSSGFLGSQLRTALGGAGHFVVRLVRGTPTAADQIQWRPYDEPLDPSVLDEVDVVVNLAGSPTVGNPHSKRWAHELERSRVETTRTLAEAIAKSDTKPVFLAGNGISFYGDHDGDVVDESSESRGDNLLTRVARNWQAAAQPAVDAGARVCVLRTSPVLDRRSSPLNAHARLFRLGLGGPLGSGDQYFPCISTDDWVRALIFCADHADLDGPVNLTLAQPATNDEFTQALGALVHRPTLFKVPSFVLRPAAGPMAPELLGSVRVVPQALLDAGFEFRHPDIRSTLEAGLAAGR
jgi:uncharacterized protein (TIGR01777 family)